MCSPLVCKMLGVSFLEEHQAYCRKQNLDGPEETKFRVPRGLNVHNKSRLIQLLSEKCRDTETFLQKIPKNLIKNVQYVQTHYIC